MLPPEHYENEIRKILIPRVSTLTRDVKTQAETNRRKRDLINKQKIVRAIRKDIVNNIRDVRLESTIRLSNSRYSTGLIKTIIGDNNFSRFISSTTKEGIVLRKNELIQAYNHVKVKIDRKDALLEVRKESLRKHADRLKHERR